MNGENVKDPHLQSEKSGKMKAYLIMAIKKLLKITAVFFIVLSFLAAIKAMIHLSMTTRIKKVPAC